MPPVTPRRMRRPSNGRTDYSPRRRGTTRYSIWPSESSSSERVVSFFSRGERSRGNSLRMRARLAATSTPRYLLAARPVVSSGVKTRIDAGTKGLGDSGVPLGRSGQTMDLIVQISDQLVQL